MIYLRSKRPRTSIPARDRAHQFRPRVVLKFGVAPDDGLNARKCTLHIKQWPRRHEQVEQGSCADPGIFVRPGGGRGPTARKQSGQCFFSHQLILQFTEWNQWFYYRGEEGINFFQGVSKETDITCDFPAGVWTP